jgi:hypothetical protein
MFFTQQERGMIMTNHESFEKHDETGPHHTCRVCTSSYSHQTHPSFFGICERCGYKILILLVIVMVVASYMAWFGVF